MPRSIHATEQDRLSAAVLQERERLWSGVREVVDSWIVWTPEERADLLAAMARVFQRVEEVAGA